MTGFNLSEWALRHRSFTWYLILALTLAGGLAYIELGREEDPDFTIKTMVVQTNWPGATIEDTINLVTDPIEKKLEEVPTSTTSRATPSQDSRSSTSTSRTTLRWFPTCGTRSARRSPT